jgi:hypothetical protein
MKRLLVMTTLMLFNGCLAGCISSMDKSLMEMRAAANANEKLYAAASLKFVDVADQMALFKHMLQSNIIRERGDAWLLAHTKDGVVTASAEDFATMLTKRDADATQLGESKSVWLQTAGDYRRMISDKQAFSALIYSKEVDAQAAKESLDEATNSVVKALIGAASTAAIAVPLLVP